MHISLTTTHTTTVACAALLHECIRFEPIGDNVSEQEKRLGTTHILAIPLIDGIPAAVAGEIAVITIDFRLPRRIRLLKKAKMWPGERVLVRRARRLQRDARAFKEKLAPGACDA